MSKYFMKITKGEIELLEHTGSEESIKASMARSDPNHQWQEIDADTWRLIPYITRNHGGNIEIARDHLIKSLDLLERRFGSSLPLLQ